MMSVEKPVISFLKLFSLSNNNSLSSFWSVVRARLCNRCGDQLPDSVGEVGKPEHKLRLKISMCKFHITYNGRNITEFQI